MSEQRTDNTLSRRNFLRFSVFAGAGVALGDTINFFPQTEKVKTVEGISIDEIVELFNQEFLGQVELALPESGERPNKYQLAHMYVSMRALRDRTSYLVNTTKDGPVRYQYINSENSSSGICNCNTEGQQDVVQLKTETDFNLETFGVTTFANPDEAFFHESGHHAYLEMEENLELNQRVFELLGIDYEVTDNKIQSVETAMDMAKTLRRYLKSGKDQDKLFLLYPASLETMVASQTENAEATVGSQTDYILMITFPNELIGGVLADAVLRIDREDFKDQFREGMYQKYLELAEAVFIDKLSSTQEAFDFKYAQYPMSVKRFADFLSQQGNFIYEEVEQTGSSAEWIFTGRTENPFKGRLTEVDGVTQVEIDQITVSGDPVDEDTRAFAASLLNNETSNPFPYRLAINTTNSGKLYVDVVQTMDLFDGNVKKGLNHDIRQTIKPIIESFVEQQLDELMATVAENIWGINWWDANGQAAVPQSAPFADLALTRIDFNQETVVSNKMKHGQSLTYQFLPQAQDVLINSLAEITN